MLPPPTFWLKVFGTYTFALLNNQEVRKYIPYYMDFTRLRLIKVIWGVSKGQIIKKPNSRQQEIGKNWEKELTEFDINTWTGLSVSSVVFKTKTD